MYKYYGTCQEQPYGRRYFMVLRNTRLGRTGRSKQTLGLASSTISGPIKCLQCPVTLWESSKIGQRNYWGRVSSRGFGSPHYYYYLFRCTRRWCCRPSSQARRHLLSFKLHGNLNCGWQKSRQTVWLRVITVRRHVSISKHPIVRIEKYGSRVSKNCCHSMTRKAACPLPLR